MFVALRRHHRLRAVASDANGVQALPVSAWRLMEDGRQPLAGITASIVPTQTSALVSPMPRQPSSPWSRRSVHIYRNYRVVATS